MDRIAFIKGVAVGSIGAASLAVAKRADAAGAAPTGFADVTAFGADPTGTMPSGLAFVNAAIAAQTTPGCVLWIPPGTYDLVAMAPILVSRLEIVGAGRDQVTLMGSATASFLVPQNGSSLKMSGLTARGFKYVVQATPEIDLESVEISHCGFHEIAIQVFGGGGGVNYGEIDRFVFAENVATQIGENAVLTAAAVKLSAETCNHARIEGNVISGVGSATKVGESFGIYLRLLGFVDLENDVKTFVLNNDIRGVDQNDPVATCSGIVVLGGQTAIQGNHIEGVVSHAGSPDNHGIYTKCRNSVISGNTLINCGGYPGVITCKGMNREETMLTATPGYDVVISHNAIRQDPGTTTTRSTGIAITRDGCVVSHNHVTGTQRGIDVWSSAKNTLIQGNLIFGLTAHVPGDFLAGVNTASIDDCLILDNQIVGLSDGTHRFGIYVKDGGASGPLRGCLIRGNWIADLTPQDANSIGVRIATTTSLVKVVVESNHVDVAGWAVYADDLSLVGHSASVWNSASNAALGAIYPSASSWTVYQQ